MHDVTYPETLAWVDERIARGGRHQICTVNAEFIIRAQHDPAFNRLLLNSDLNVPDGISMIWAARRGGHPLRERVTGSDLLPQMCARAAHRGWRVFFLGAAEGVADACAARMQADYPGLNVCGTFAGNAQPDGDAEALAHLAVAQPNLLFVAYGAPAQDKWLARNLPAIGVERGGLVGIGVGGAFDFVTGRQKRAPLAVRKLGLEWLWRLALQPQRLQRQLSIPEFIVRVLLTR